MKYTKLLLLLASGLLLFRPLYAKTEQISEQATRTVQTQVLDKLKPDTHPMRMFSRVMLAPPALEWRESLSPTLRSFVVTHGGGQLLMGVYSSENDQVWLLDVNALEYVEVKEHAVFKQLVQPQETRKSDSDRE